MYVYDSNSNLYQFVNTYKTYLEGKGAIIKSARLLRLEEAIELGCETSITWSCNSAPAFVKETSYWFGSAYYHSGIWGEYFGGGFNYGLYNDSTNFGVRPVIVI